MSAKNLPPPFADLGSWTEKWCIETKRERSAERVASSIADLKTFYEVLLPRMEEIIDYLNTLDATRPADMSAEDRNLFRLCQSFLETSSSLELVGAGARGIFALNLVEVDIDG